MIDDDYVQVDSGEITDMVIFPSESSLKVVQPRL